MAIKSKGAQRVSSKVKTKGAEKSTLSQQPANRTSASLRPALLRLFTKGIVLQDFPYQSVKMDYAVVVTDRLIEIRHIRTRDEYASELSTIVRAGAKVKYDKHKSIQAARYIASAFYFLAPPGVLKLEELPPHYGLITYKDGESPTFRREAEWIGEEYLSKSFYKTLAEKLYQQLYPAGRDDQ